MTKLSLILTGLEESRTFTRTSVGIEEAIHGKSNFKPSKEVTRFLVFNDGEFKVPCDQDTFTNLIIYWGNKKEENKLIDKFNDTETLIELFGGDDSLPSSIPSENEELEKVPPIPPSWVGAEDDGEDGVGQV